MRVRGSENQSWFHAPPQQVDMGNSAAKKKKAAKAAEFSPLYEGSSTSSSSSQDNLSLSYLANKVPPGGTSWVFHILMLNLLDEA